MTNEPPQDLADAARAVRNNAYVPYSDFRVGAALRADDGTVFAGANVENGSFGLTRCAEQSAIMALVSSGARQFSELVVHTEASPPASPCGSCRQILAEFSRDARVWLVNSGGESISTTVRELLPLDFNFRESTA